MKTLLVKVAAWHGITWVPADWLNPDYVPIVYDTSEDFAPYCDIAFHSL
jgi:hypothetical protein